MKKTVIITLVLLAIALLGGGIWWKFFYKKKTAKPNSSTTNTTTTSDSGGIVTPPPIVIIPITDPLAGKFEKQLVLVNNKDLYYVLNNELLLVDSNYYNKLSSVTYGFGLPVNQVNSLTDLKSYINNNKAFGNKALLLLFEAKKNSLNTLFSTNTVTTDTGAGTTVKPKKQIKKS